LSIHWHEPIVLNDDALFEKIVLRRRGGFCYELNGLFAALLRSLGFEATMLSAEVANDKGEFGPPFDHLTLLVTLGERWLADVGFGDSFSAPLLLDERQPQVQGDSAFRVDADGDRFVLFRRGEGAAWLPRYRFDLTPHAYADYEAMCRYHQQSPESHFTRKRICSRATIDGRVTLTDTRLITTRGRERQEIELADEAQYAGALRETFGILPRERRG
jgi:N-hydroxyarylamine O-acetyltransferase